MATERNVLIRWQSDDADAVRGAARVSDSLRETSSSASSAGRATQGAYKATASAARDAEPAVRKSSKALKEVADVGGDAERVALGVADVLEMLGLEAAAAGARIAGDLGGGLEGILKGGTALAPVLTAVAAVAGVVAGVVAVGGTAYLAYANAVSEGRAETDAIIRTLSTLDTQLGLSADAIEAANAEWDAFSDKARDARDAINVINGLTDEQTVKTQRQVEALEEESFVALRTAGLQVAAAKQRIALNQELIDQGKLTFTGEVKARAAISESKEELASATVTLEQRRSVLKQATQDVADQIEYEATLAETTKTVAERDREAEAALRKREEAIRAAEAATRSLEAITANATAKTLEGEEAILFARDRQLAAIDALVAEGATEADGVAARLAVEQQAHNEIAALRQQDLDDYRQALAEQASAHYEAAQLSQQIELDAQEALAEGLQARTDQAIATVEDLAGAGASVVADIFTLALDSKIDALSAAQSAFADLNEAATQSEREAAKEQIKIARDAAREAFIASKAASIAQAVINGALSVTKTLAELGFTPVGIAASVLAAAATGVQVAAIQKQDFTFDDGGMVRSAAAQLGRGPGQIDITARDGEGVLTGQGVNAIGGRQGLAAANRGESPGGGIRASFVVGPKVSAAQYLQASGASGELRAATRGLRPSGRTNPYR